MSSDYKCMYENRSLKFKSWPVSRLMKLCWKLILSKSRVLSVHKLKSWRGEWRLTVRQRERDTNCNKTSGATIHSEKKKWFASQSFYSASGCARSDVSVRSQSESLSLLLLSIDDSLLLLSVANISSQQLYIFTMNNKETAPINTSNKCSFLFPYFPS
jgi:hypothetical protein